MKQSKISSFRLLGVSGSGLPLGTSVEAMGSAGAAPEQPSFGLREQTDSPPHPLMAQVLSCGLHSHVKKAL